MKHHVQRSLDRAIKLHAEGKLPEAIRLYQEITQQEQDCFPAFANLGMIYFNQGLWDEAEPYLRQASCLDDSNFELQYVLAVSLQKNGKNQDAIQIYQHLAKLQPDNAKLFSNLGVALKRQGHFEDAINCYQQAIRIQPHYPTAYYNLGLAHQAAGQANEAIFAFQQALQLNSNYPDAYNSLGSVLFQQGLTNEAIEAYQKAIALLPNHADAYSNLGVAYREIELYEPAIQALNQAISLNPDFSEAYYNLGLALYESGQIHPAMKAYKTAIALRPDYPEAQLSLSIAQLLTGNYVNGWKGYQWRFKAKPEKYSIPTFTAWQGGFSENTELVLIEEQGIGDSIHFIRYGKLLKGKFKCLSIAVRETLAKFMEQTQIFDKVYSLPLEEALVPPNAQWVYLLSIPEHLQVSASNPLLTDPYIHVDPDKDQAWRSKIHKDSSLIIGLNWQGNPNTEKYDFKGRSLSLSEYEPLASIPGIQFVSLQKGFGSEQLETCAFRDRFADCQNEINETWDWVETTAIINNCDLIITSDTSIAHVAGALGKPTWILLKKFPDWRWGLEGQNCCWYPSATLFRQTEAGQWTDVIHSIRDELQKFPQP